MSTQPRRIFQIDGEKGGVLNIAEKPNQNLVVLVITQGDKEAQISLIKEDFEELCNLRYSLRFGEAEPQETALKAVA
jgi:hypothetical protein